MARQASRPRVASRARPRAAAAPALDWRTAAAPNDTADKPVDTALTQPRARPGGGPRAARCPRCGIFWETYHIHRHFLDSSKNLKDEDPGGHTHLHNACFSADFQRAKLVALNEKDLACKRTYGQGNTPAHYCTYLNLDGRVETRFKILKLLAHVNPECIFVKNMDGSTPYDVLLGYKGKFMDDATKMAQWLYERMTTQGRIRLSMIGWFKVSEVKNGHHDDILFNALC
jgi:hypothetical protein